MSHGSHDPVLRVNDKHAEDLLAVARSLCGQPDATSARAERIDADGIDLVISTPAGQVPSRIDFNEPVADPRWMRAAFMDLAKRARAVGDPPPADLGHITFSPGAEDWIEWGPVGARARVAFHDYAGIYAVPGLYERVFYVELGMRTSQRVVGWYGDALLELGRPPAGERVIDLGAGNGLGGEELRRLGVAGVIGVDREPEARTAACRDRPTAYDDYVVADLATMSEEGLARLCAVQPTAVLALAALGAGHAQPAVLDRALTLLSPGGLFAFAVTPPLLPGSDDPAGQATGYPAFLVELFAQRADELGRHEYVHRRCTDGSDHLAVAFIGRMRADLPTR